MAGLFTNLTPKGRMAMVAGAIIVLAVTVLLFRIATSPSWTTVAAGVSPSQTEKVTAALDEKGIGYELRNGGTAIAVESARAAEARVALQAKGVGGGPAKDPGFEIFDKQKLGTSEFQQQVDYQRALEGEIARTVEQVEGAGTAQVQLVLPEDELFADEASKASAAVLLSGGAELDPGSVRGIAQLVSSSVKGLQSSAVTITDGGGRLLWPADGAAGGAGGPTTRASAEGRYEQQLDARLSSLLTQTLGPGKARVTSSVDLSTDEVTEDRLTYADKGVPLKTTSEEEELEGGGAAGADVPAAAQAAGSNYKKSTSQTDFGVNKTVTRVKVAPGKVERLSLAVLVDKSVKPDQVEALEEALASAAGIDDGRGDAITVTQVAFAKPPKAAAVSKPLPVEPMSAARYAGIGLAALLFLFFAMKSIKKREAETLGDPTWVREITAPVRLNELEPGHPHLPVTAHAGPKQDLAAIARTDPERVATQVRAWMADE